MTAIGAVAIAWILAAPGERPEARASEVVVLEGRANRTTSAAAIDAWLSGRMPRLIAYRLALLGMTVRDTSLVDLVSPTELARAGVARVSVTVQSKGAALTASLAVELIAELDGRPSRSHRIHGTLRALDRVADEAATWVAGTLGAPRASASRILLEDFATPLPVHEFLGAAADRAKSGDLVRAKMSYARAEGFSERSLALEAYAGRHAIDAIVIGRGGNEREEENDLALSSLERARVASRSGQLEEALRAYRSFFAYSRATALRWSIALPAGERMPDVHVGERRWVLEFDSTAKGRITFEPRTGFVLDRSGPIDGLVATTGDDFLTLVGSEVRRLDERLRERWKCKLPNLRGTRVDARRRIELTSGLLGVGGDESVSWVEVSLGTLGQVARNVVPVASSVAGMAILLPQENSPKSGSPTRELALLRPGKNTPAWQVAVPEPHAVEMTLDRVLVFHAGGLSILNGEDGRLRKNAIPLPADARPLAASGRFAVVRTGPTRAMLVDILDASVVATLEGPDVPVLALALRDGAAVVFRNGELAFFDVDGRIVDRVLLNGIPRAIFAGNALAPGPVVLTTRGLFAYAEVGRDVRATRDVDVLIEAGRLLDRMGEQGEALRVATHVALRSNGRIADAETLRAELLERRTDSPSREAASHARVRAEAARDPSKAIPPFSLVPR